MHAIDKSQTAPATAPTTTTADLIPCPVSLKNCLLWFLLLLFTYLLFLLLLLLAVLLLLLLLLLLLQPANDSQTTTSARFRVFKFQATTLLFVFANISCIPVTIVEYICCLDSSKGIYTNVAALSQ